MPKIFEVGGYIISIWSNENGEPIHVHISKRRPSINSTKVWLLSNGDVLLANNKSKIDRKTLTHILKMIKLNYNEIVQYWLAYHGYIKYYK